MSAYDNRWQRMFPHYFLQRFHAIHAWHVEVERNHVGLQVRDLFQRKCAVHRRSYNLDRALAFNQLRDQLPHKRGVVDNENSNWLLHTAAPTPVARDNDGNGALAGILTLATRSNSAGVLRMRTTAPSPMMDAPLTRS